MSPVAIRDREPRGADVTLQDIIAAGLVKLPLEIQKTYKGHHLVGRITADGNATWGGQEYGSLSTAAGMARASIIGNSAWAEVSADQRLDVLAVRRR